MKESLPTKHRLSYLIIVGLFFALISGVQVSAETISSAAPDCVNNSCTFLPLIVKRSPLIPNAPVLTVTEITENERYNLDWSDGADTETLFWELQGSSDSNFNARELIQVNDTSYELTTTGGVRYYRVRGVGEGGFGDWSNVVEINASSFRADKTVVDRSVDECATLSWNYSGIKAFKVKLGHGYDLQAANGVDSVQVCPSIKTTYVAQVTNVDDSVETYEVTIDVTGSGCNIDPYIIKFTSSNTNPNPNETFTISWDTACATAIFYKAGNIVAERPVTGTETHEESTPSDATYVLRVQVRNGDTVIKEGLATITIDVK